MRLAGKENVRRFVSLSIAEYERGNHLFFTPLLPKSVHWRAYPEFKGTSCFIDIETTGLSKRRNDVTTIGVYDGTEPKVFINGINLQEFPEEIKKYSMLISFNGICFDIPFLKCKFPELEFSQFHVDLRYALRQLGYTGGLKHIERVLGISRDSEVEGIDGLEAVRLWHRYKKGDAKALDTLVKYNIEDIVNLKQLMEFAYDGLRKDSMAKFL